MTLLANFRMNTGWTDWVSGYDGTPVGAVINTVSPYLGAGDGSFDGLNDEITYSSFADPSGAAAWSIDGYLKSTAGDSFDAIFGWWDGTYGIGIQSSTTVSNGLAVYAGDGFGAQVTGLDTTSVFGHFALVYDGSLSGNANRLKLYYKGTLQSLTFNPSANIPAVLPTITGTPKMGNIPNLVRYWKGRLDDIAIYNHALTQTEVTSRYNGGIGREIEAAVGNRRKKMMKTLMR